MNKTHISYLPDGTPNFSDSINQSTSQHTAILEDTQPDISYLPDGTLDLSADIWGTSKDHLESTVPPPAETAANNLNAAGRYTQQQVIAARQHAAKLGADFSDTLAHGAAAARHANAVTPDDLHNYSPALLEALANNGKTTFAAKEDLPAVNAIASAFASPLSGLSGGLSMSEVIRANKDAPGFAEWFDAIAGFGARSLHTAVFDTPGVAKKTGHALTHGAADFNTALAGGALMASENIFGPQSLPAQWARQALARIESARPPKVTSDSAVGQFGYDFVRSAPPQAANLIALIAGPFAGLMAMGAQISGQSYADSREKDISPGRAMTSALLNAAAQAPLERFALGKSLDVFNARGLWEVAKKTIGASATEFITEYTQKAPELVTALWAEAEKKGTSPADQISWFHTTLLDADTLVQAHSEAVYEGLIGAAWGGLFGGISATKNSRPAPQADQQALTPELAEFFSLELTQARNYAERHILTKALDTAAANIDTMATMQQGPQVVAEILNEVIPQALKQTWIGADDALTLYQQATEQGEASAVLDALGMDVESLQAAVQQGVPLPVSTATMLTHLSGDTRSRALNELRNTPDGISGTEAAAYNPEARANEVLQRLTDNISDAPESSTTALAVARSSQQIRADVDREVTRITHEIEATGFPRHTAKTYAQLYAQHALAMRAAYGVDPVQLLHGRSFNVAQGMQAGPNEIQLAHSADETGTIKRVTLRGDELGVSEDSAIKDHQKAARAVYRILQKTPANRDDLGEIVFTKAGWDESTHTGSDRRKWKLFPKLKEIIEGARYIERKPLHKQRKDNIVAFHWLEADVTLADEHLRVGIQIAEDTNGKKFYNVNQDLDEWNKIYKAPGASPATSDAGPQELSQSAIAPVDTTIISVDDNVNMSIVPQSAATALGSVTLTPDSAAVKIFSGANLSTIPHESAHIFLDDLMRIASDDGSIALAELRRAASITLKGEAHELMRQAHSSIDALAQAAPGERLDALHTLAADVRAQARTAAASAKQLAADATSQKQEDDNNGIVDSIESRPWKELRRNSALVDAQAIALGRFERTIRKAIMHLSGLDKARADIDTLQSFANVAKGPLVRGSEDFKKVHESTARAFEQYLLEGKSPSANLDGVFNRLRAWLMQVYKDARDTLGLPITDNVRRVFDRMLATDQEMRQSTQLRNTLAAERDFTDNHVNSYEEWRKLSDILNDAEREVQATADRATLRDRNKRYKEYYTFALETIESMPFWQMVDNISVRKREFDGSSSGGITRDSIVSFIGAEQTAELSRARPGIINAQGGGLPVDIAGQEHGYYDTDQFVNELYDTLVMRRETKKSLAKALATQQLESDDNLRESEALSLSADEYGAYLDKVDEAVLRMAARKGYRTPEEQNRFIRNSITPRSRIKAMAEQSLRSTPFRNILPARYQGMLDTAMRERSRALIDGDIMGAVKAVENARLANELLWASRARLAERDDMLKLAVKTASAKPGTLPIAYREAIRKLLGQYDLAHMSGLTEAKYQLASLRQLVEQTLQEDVTDVLPSFAAWILDTNDPKTGLALQGGRMRYNDLTPAQLSEVKNLLSYLIKSGYNARTDVKDSQAAIIQDIATKAAAAMHELPTIPVASTANLKSKAQEAARGLYAAIDSLRFQLRKSDGFTNLTGQGNPGPVENALLSKILEGERQVHKRIMQINTLMAPHLLQLGQSVKDIESRYGKNLMVKDGYGRPVELPQSMQKAYGRKSWTSDMLIALALNCGNASNMSRIRSGYPDLQYETLATLLGDQMATNIMRSIGDQNEYTTGNRAGLLSLKDWQAVQGIWDALATQWEDTQATHERMFGFKPDAVAHQPITLTDLDGQTVHLAGGYYPVRYDPNISDRAANWSEHDDIMSRNESMFAVPAAKRGHTTARVKGLPELPLRLDTSIIMEHLNDAVRFIELAEIVRLGDSVTRHALFRSAYTDAFGRKDYDAIRPNLRGLVRTEPPPKSDWVVSFANFMRKYLVPWGLAWNIKVAALQFTAVFPAMGDVGAKYVLRGMAQIRRQGMDALRQIWEVSPYMKSRLDNLDQDLQRHIAEFDPVKRSLSVNIAGRQISWQDIVNAGMLPIVAVDAVATSSVWIGAYNKKISQLQMSENKYRIDADNEFHKTAVEFADSMVKQSNPDYDASSRSGFLRAQNSYRLVNSFSSAVTLFAARHKYMYTAHAKGKISHKGLARFELFETIVPATAMFMFLALARGYVGSDEDEAKDVAELLTASMIDFATMRLPMFGSAVGDGFMRMMGFAEGGHKASGLRTSVDMPFQLFGNISGQSGRAGRALLDGGTLNEAQAKNLIYAVADIISVAARVPVSKVVRNAERGYGQWQRGEGTPLSMAIPRPGK